MEEKERYEIHIYDDICVDLYDNGVLDKSINDTYKLEELLNQQDKRIKELDAENKNLNKQLSLTEKAYKIAIFELDFARHHSQSTSQETVDRIEKLEIEIWNKAKEKMKSE